MPSLSSRGIFLSYRREDAAPYARLLQSQLSERIPDARVFMDVDSIEPGRDFAEVTREAVDSCAVLVALIGRQWATIADEEGRRRLDAPDDYVRFEVQTALERGVRVIPVLVDDARPPRQQQLPAELQKLARLNALELSYGRYQYDADRLVDLIQRVLAVPPGTDTVHQVSASADADTPAVTRPLSVRPDENALGGRCARTCGSSAAGWCRNCIRRIFRCRGSGPRHLIARRRSMGISRSPVPSPPASGRCGRRGWSASAPAPG